METKNLKPFPADFLWGASTAAFQAEGAAHEDGKGDSVMDVRKQDPSICNYEVAADHYHHYKEDIALMKECGLKAYRFSIAWTRIFPNGNGEINQKGVDHYNDVINECIASGITPIVTLYHFEYPQGLVEQYGGWLDRRSIDDYVNYCKFCFQAYGDRVKYWLTINEQDHVVHMPFRLGFASTNIYEDEKKGFLANHNMCVAAALAIQACHEMVEGGKIGPAVCFDMLYPTSNKPEDALAWLDAMDIRNYYVLDMNVKGEYNGTFKRYLQDRNMMPEIKDGDMEIMKANKPDFIGFNYYASKSISAFPTDENHPIGDITIKLLPSEEAGCYKVVKNNNLNATLWGWEIDDIGLESVSRLLWDRYHLPLLITENGFGNKEEVNNETGRVEDDDRIDYLSRHLLSVKKSMNVGVEYIGYCAWSFMDIVSGHSGFSKRYGFVRVNRDEHDLKDLARSKKKSFDWYKETIACNGENIK